jgi:hypothetical protein
MKIFLLLFLVSSANGIYITCRFHIDYYWGGGLGYVYTCYVKSADFSDNSTHITGVGGTHESGFSDADVKMIYFGWIDRCPENLQKIPKGFKKYFPNFIALEFSICPISTLNGDELDEYPNLQWYIHVHSNLTRIPENFFKSTLKMKYIDFSFNKIQNVGANLLDHLKNLQKVFFWGNTCIGRYADSASEVPALIEELRQKCPDIEPEATTQLTTTLSIELPTTIPSSSTPRASSTSIFSVLSCLIVLGYLTCF